MSLVSRLTRLLRAEVGGRFNLPRVGQTRSTAASSEDTYADAAYTDQHTTQDEQSKPRASYDAQLASYYAALELPYGADIQAVKQAHRRLVKQYHPDRFYEDATKQHTAGEVTRRLNEAYQELCQHLQASS